MILEKRSHLDSLIISTGTVVAAVIAVVPSGRNVALSASLFGGIALITIAVSVWLNRRAELPLLTGLELSTAANKRLRKAKLLRVSETRAALFELLESAQPQRHSLLAICGWKGDYAHAYYRLNFATCKTVIRIFSYDAIVSEMTQKQEKYALEGLKFHLDRLDDHPCAAQVHLIPKNKSLKQMLANFDPPHSFGVAILLDGNTPLRAVLHWEMHAVGLRHLISLEGVVIDRRQKDVLHKLVKVHHDITSSHYVLCSNSDREAIDKAVEEMEKEWSKQHTTKVQP